MSERNTMPPLVERVRIVASDIKLSHSVFALPFALLAAVFALAHAGPIEWRRAALPLVLVVLAMVFARTAAMIANRLLDRAIDARNPRTAGRAIPSGRLEIRHAIAAFTGSSIAFVGVCGLFAALLDNWWPIALSVPVLGWICVYGLLKRFTWACHLWLGASLAMSVPAAALAVEPHSLQSPAIWWLASAVLCWVAGFDVIYSLQDEAIDRAERLHSLPSRFGVQRALWASRTLHLLCVASFVMAWRSDPRLGWIFGAAVVAAAILLVIEHATVRLWGTTRLAITFFTINGCVSLLIGGAGIAAIILSEISA